MHSACAGKPRYQNLDDAQEALLRLAERIAAGAAVHTNHGRLGVYACVECGSYHVGHRVSWKATA